MENLLAANFLNFYRLYTLQIILIKSKKYCILATQFTNRQLVVNIKLSKTLTERFQSLFCYFYVFNLLKF